MNINTNTPIDHNNWGVTLACKKKENRLKQKTTRIIFEGFLEMEYFVKIAKIKICIVPETYMYFLTKNTWHSKPRIETQYIHPSRTERFRQIQDKYEMKSPTFIGSSEKIAQLIREIQTERSKKLDYNDYGDRSIFSSKTESVYIYDTTLAKISLLDKELFAALVDSTQAKSVRGMRRVEFDQRINVVNQKLTEIFTYEGLIDLVQKNCFYQESGEHNSFTWCRSKVEKLGVKFDCFYHEKIKSVASSHLKLSMDQFVTKLIPKNDYQKENFLDHVVVLDKDRETGGELVINVKTTTALALIYSIPYFSVAVIAEKKFPMISNLFLPLTFGSAALTKMWIDKELYGKSFTL